jgi:hypothetical protein
MVDRAGRHPQYPLLESFWDNKHRARVIAEDRWVSVDDYFCVFIDFFNML